MELHYFFKLFNNIKEEHEIDLAELELRSLFGDVERVRNVFDVMVKEPFLPFLDGDLRVQDVLTYELPYGRFHGFYSCRNTIQDVSLLIRRLAYTREIFLAMESVEDPSLLLSKLFPKGVLGKNVQFWVKNDVVLFRFITHQYFLEKSEYVNKLSRNEEEVDRNVKVLMDFPTKEIYRIPSSSTMKVGKRLQDYFAIREEESLYLTHKIHPYKGKFHAKMCRALLNYVLPREDGLVLDNFAGSGTLLLEASLMGIDSIGVEVNPLSALMSNVKCFALSFDYEKLKKDVQEYLNRYKGSSANSIILKPLPEFVKKSLDEETLKRIELAKELLKGVEDERVKDFFTLILSGAISDAVRRRKADFDRILKDRFEKTLLRIYTFKKLNELLKIDLGSSKTLLSDARDMKQIADEGVDAIVTSPPYSTAINYVENDKFQLALLELASLEDLARRMIGHPDTRFYESMDVDLSKCTPLLKETISNLLHRRRDAALRTYKFHVDMKMALKEMHRVLKRGGKCAIIIGNNKYKVDGEAIEVENDRILIEMGEEMGFLLDLYLKRPLEKTSSGSIRYESIVVFNK